MFSQYLSERSKYFTSIWSSYGCSHAGSLFTNEEKKRLGLGYILILCHTFSALFMMLPKETSWHKMHFEFLLKPPKNPPSWLTRCKNKTTQVPSFQKIMLNHLYLGQYTDTDITAGRHGESEKDHSSDKGVGGKTTSSPSQP